MQLTLDGLILRHIRAGDDRILKILTAEQGVLTAFARKANAPRSKLASATEQFCYTNLVLFHSRDRYTVDKADANRMFFGLRGDYDKLCLASYFAQLALELCPQGEPAPEPLRLLLNCLHLVEEGARDRRLLKPLFELRLLTLTGFMPNLVACRDCGCYEAERMVFFPVSGDLLCGDCLGDRRPSGGSEIGPGVLAAMRHILYAGPDKLFAFALADPALGSLYALSESYLLTQVEKIFSALEMYRSTALLDNPCKID